MRITDAEETKMEYATQEDEPPNLFGNKTVIHLNSFKVDVMRSHCRIPGTD